MAFKTTLLQEDNLVRFLNAATFADDVLGVLDDEIAPEFAEQAKKMLKVRDEMGAFFNIFDVEKGLDSESPLGRALLKAARRPLVMGPAISRVAPALALEAVSPVIFGRILACIISWAEEPPEWRPLRLMSLAYGDKALQLQIRLEAAEQAFEAARQYLKLFEGTNNDPSNAEDAVQRALDLVNEIMREAAALNAAVQGRNHQAAWAIIRRNLVADIDALKAQARALANPANMEQVRKKQQLEDEIEQKEKRMKAVDEEVAAFKG